MSAAISSDVDIPLELQDCVIAQAFESGFLHGPVWRLKAVPDRRLVSPLLDFLEASGTKLAMCRIDARHAEDANRLSEAGFRRVETLLTLACDRAAAGEEWDRQMPATIRTATIADVAVVESIAAHAFAHDRFHADAYIANDVADAIKSAWAGNDVRSRADAVFLAIDGCEVVGFNACLRRDHTATIDLIAVAPSAQGRGFGRQLVEASLAHYRPDIRIMYVGTQSNNATAVALYQALGFHVIRSELTFHWTPKRGSRTS